MITLLENILQRADGNYVNARDLQLLDQSLSTWQVRKQTYNTVHQSETAIIDHALAAMRSGDRFATKPLDSLGIDRCRRDMTLGLRCCALAMLMEDEELIKDRVLYWQQNVFLAMQLNYQGYKFMGGAIKALIPSAQSELMNPYMNMAHAMMSRN